MTKGTTISVKAHGFKFYEISTKKEYSNMYLVVEEEDRNYLYLNEHGHYIKEADTYYEQVGSSYILHGFHVLVYKQILDSKELAIAFHECKGELDNNLLKVREK